MKTIGVDGFSVPILHLIYDLWKGVALPRSKTKTLTHAWARCAPPPRRPPYSLALQAGGEKSCSRLLVLKRKWKTFYVKLNSTPYTFLSSLSSVATFYWSENQKLDNWTGFGRRGMCHGYLAQIRLCFINVCVWCEVFARNNEMLRMMDDSLIKDLEKNGGDSLGYCSQKSWIRKGFSTQKRLTGNLPVIFESLPVSSN